MENKEKLNQNPEVVENAVQEENSPVQETAESIINESKDVKAEEAEGEVKEKVEKVEKVVEVAEVVETVTDSAPEVIEDVSVAVESTPEVAEEVAVIAEGTPEILGETSSDEEEDDAHEDENVSEETYHEHTLEQLVEEMDKVVASESVKNTKNKVGYIRLVFGRKLADVKQAAEEKFLTEGGIKEEYKPETIDIEYVFNRSFNQYKKLRRKLRVEQDAIMVENLAKKNELLEEIRVLVSSDETLKETYDKFNEIQTRWKSIGMVPKTDIQILWNNYHFLVEKFFDKVKINKELRDLDLKKNLEAKIALCEKAEELLIEKSVNKSFKLLQDYHNEWKAIGPVPTSNNEEIWERFKVASDKLNDRRKAHYEELQGKLEENYEAKKALCTKAEELVLTPVETNKQWTKRTEEIDDLMKVWKTLGPAPRNVNDEVWATFKGILNQFYDAKKEFFGSLKAEQQDNYHKKLDLVKQSEALKDSTDWGAATKTLINLQKEWKTIGPTPRKHSDEIWKKFRAANDFFFETKAKHFKGQFEKEDENLKLKQDLIGEIKTAEYGEDKKENLEKIKVFQRRWTEIGNVPRKEMDKLYKDYRGAIDEQLNKLDISSVDFRNAGFRDRIGDLKKNDDDYTLRRERQNIQNAMDKLKEDVLLWENNMGFFRNSKNADVLKMEFEKKIKKAKADILVLKEKIKMIDK
ncbi:MULTISPECIES: DUF349 domain-containing protein [unclassified Lentimicrobium]|uniref:DUF349 domain-containing protein n=1 Tax=unclassified Lentimicrobium TaxID=2677434 RepID=UPI00155538C3|nr:MULTISPECIES: DUF349 domain-containing protein [unclassified Lentimicrobium]NPD45199.1 DUF349 domain-containing protein [Lentimicrobium sp. S6]NPD86569.1 DUF349 domain-containing protein [Lentimicrobium sp. L6]